MWSFRCLKLLWGWWVLLYVGLSNVYYRTESIMTWLLDTYRYSESDVESWIAAKTCSVLLISQAISHSRSLSSKNWHSVLKRRWHPWERAPHLASLPRTKGRWWWFYLVLGPPRTSLLSAYQPHLNRARGIFYQICRRSSSITWVGDLLLMANSHMGTSSPGTQPSHHIRPPSPPEMCHHVWLSAYQKVLTKPRQSAKSSGISSKRLLWL